MGHNWQTGETITAALLNGVAQVADIGTPGTPTGDALKAASGAVAGQVDRYSRGESLHRATLLGSAVMTTPPAITTVQLAADNYDQGVIFYEANSVSGQYGVLGLHPNHANPANAQPARVRCLAGGIPKTATHSFLPTIDAAFATPQNWKFEIAHYGTKITFTLVSYGGGTNGGFYRIKVDGRYVSLTPTALPGTGPTPVTLDFTNAGGAAARTIQLELGTCALNNIQTLANDAVWLPPRAASPRWYVVGDSFADGAGSTDGAGGVFKGLVPQLMRRLGIDDSIVDSAGGTGVLQRNGSNNNFVDRATTNLPLCGTVDAALVIGSVNDTSQDPTALTTQTRALYDLLGALPVFHIVMPGSGGASGMAATLGAYQAAAAGRANVHVCDLTDALTGTGNVGTPQPLGTNSILRSSDGTHPSQAGHDYYAQRGAAWLDTLLPGLN